MSSKASRRRPGTRIACLALVSLLPLVSCRSDDSRTGRSRERPVAAESPAGPPTAADIRAALLAVEYWSDPRRPAIAEHLRPIPLEQAAKILARDGAQGSFGASRRNRAWITLLVAGLDVQSDHPPVHPVHEHQAALVELDVAPLSEIDALIESIAADFPRQPGVLVERHVLLEYIRTHLELALSQKFAAMALSGSCSLVGASSTKVSKRIGIQSYRCGDLAPNEAKVVVEASVEVDRDYQELSQIMDPQSWDAESAGAALCNVYFDKAMVVLWNEPSQDWVEDPCPPAPGSEWSGLFWEHFEMKFESSPGQQSSTGVTNVLDIDTHLTPTIGTPTEFLANYHLNKHISTHIGGDTRGGINLDWGSTKVVPAGGGGPKRHKVESLKNVRFAGWHDPPTLGNPNPPDYSADYNALACYSLQAMGKALEQFVCCPVPPAPICMNSPGQPILLP